MKTRTLFSILLPILAFSTSALAETYRYHPNSLLTLGAGIDPSRLNARKQPCVKPNFRTVESSPMHIEVNDRLITNSRQITEIMDLDLKLDLTFTAFSAGAGYKDRDERIFKEDSASWVIYGKAEYGRQVVDPLELYPEYKALLDQGRFAEFKQECGSEYVSLQKTGILFGVIITLENLSNDQKRTITESANFSYLGVAPRVAFTQTMNTLATSHSISIRYFGYGGGGFSSLAQLISTNITSPEAIPQIQTGLQAALAGMQANTAVPISFETTPIHHSLNTNQPDLWTARRTRLLRTLVDEYRTLEILKEELAHILEPSSQDPRTLTLSEGRRTELEALLDPVDERLDLLASTHQACLVGSSLEQCRVSSSLLARTQLPNVPSAPQALRILLDQNGFPLSLKATGTDLVKVEFLWNQRKVDTVEVQQSCCGEQRELEIPLLKAWSYRSAMIRGNVSLIARFHDRYGRQIDRILYRALHTARPDFDPVQEVFEIPTEPRIN